MRGPRLGEDPRGGGPDDADEGEGRGQDQGEDQEAGPGPDAPGPQAVRERSPPRVDGLHLGGPAGGERASQRVDQVGKQERGCPTRRDGACGDEGTEPARVESRRTQGVARGKLAGGGGEGPLDGRRVGAGGRERARRVRPRADASAPAGSSHGEGHGAGHAVAGPGHRAPDGNGQEL